MEGKCDLGNSFRIRKNKYPRLQVFYNKVNTTVSPISTSTVAAASPSATYQYTTAFSDPSNILFGSLLFPGDSSANAVAIGAVGHMQTYLTPVYPLAGAAPTRLISFFVRKGYPLSR